MPSFGAGRVRDEYAEDAGAIVLAWRSDAWEGHPLGPCGQMLPPIASCVDAAVVAPLPLVDAPVMRVRACVNAAEALSPGRVSS